MTTANDDIPGATPPGQVNRQSGPRTVGPDSEVRGGPEAPGDLTSPNSTAPMPDGRPGARAGLPAGSLPTPYLGPQGDENREPPADAPAPTGAAETVEDARKSADRRGTP